MSGWAKKRFWKDATVESEEGGFGIRLDGRGVKTPAKAPLVVPTKTMADAIAAEWQAQEDEIAPLSMPVTRSANAAIDKVRIQHAEVADMLAEYGGTDLLCYRATTPAELVQRQAEQWDPLLAWAKDTLGAPLKAISGLMHEPQDEISLKLLRERVHTLSDFELAAFHDLVGLSGSLIIGFAVMHDVAPITSLWDISRLDEAWQEEKWGEDEEATKQAEIKKSAFFHAARFYGMAHQ